MAITAGPLLLCGRPLGASRPRRSSTGGRWRRQGGSHFPQHPEGRCQGSIGHCRAPVLGSAHPRTSAFCANAPAGGPSPRTSLSRPHGDRPGEERPLQRPGLGRRGSVRPPPPHRPGGAPRPAGSWRLTWVLRHRPRARRTSLSCSYVSLHPEFCVALAWGSVKM